MSFETEWRAMVQNARCGILASKRDPIKLLVDIFELYKDDFDINKLETKEPELYQHLNEFCSHAPCNISELKSASMNLAKYFTEHQNEIRSHDVQLYYALLNFMDFLKQKHIYF